MTYLTWRLNLLDRTDKKAAVSGNHGDAFTLHWLFITGLTQQMLMSLPAVSEGVRAADQAAELKRNWKLVNVERRAKVQLKTVCVQSRLDGERQTTFIKFCH